MTIFFIKEWSFIIRRELGNEDSSGEAVATKGVVIVFHFLRTLPILNFNEFIRIGYGYIDYFLSPPVLMHGGLINPENNQYIRINL